MTDDSVAERNALLPLIPNFVLLLCTFHLCQSLSRWLWYTERIVAKDDKSSVIKILRLVLYISTIEESEENLNDLILVSYAIQS